MTMSNEKNSPSKSRWQSLHDAIVLVMDQYGRKSFNRDRDFDMQDADWGWSYQYLELNTLRLLRIDILKQLQALLQDYPNTHIKVSLDIPGKEDIWPPMGLGIYPDRIDDHLVRRFLPEEYHSQAFGVAVPRPLVSSEEAQEIISVTRSNLFKEAD